MISTKTQNTKVFSHSKIFLNTMNIKLALTLLLILFSFDPVNCCLRQFAIIKPFFTKKHSIHTIRKIIDLIENKKLSYPDYDNRTGIIWSDF